MRHKRLSAVGRCANRATLFLLLCAALPSCAFIRVPLPAISFNVDVLEGQELPAFPRLVEGDARLGVIGLEIPLPYLCDLGDVDFLARAYLERLEADALGELANNIAIKRVYIEEIRLAAEEGDFTFIAEAGIRLINNDKRVTYWSEFPDREKKKVMVLRPDGNFDLFKIIPGESECATADLIYSGTAPDEKVVIAMELRLKVEADWQF